MKRRHEFRLLIADLWQALEDPKPSATEGGLWSAAWGLRFFAAQLAVDPAKLGTVFGFIRALRLANAQERIIAEKECLVSLKRVARECIGPLEEAGGGPLPDFSIGIEISAALAPRIEVLRLLHDFALESLQFKRPRDSFGGRRRACAYDLLAIIGRCIDLPQAIAIAEVAADSMGSIDGRAADEFVNYYMSIREEPHDDHDPADRGW